MMVTEPTHDSEPTGKTKTKPASPTFLFHRCAHTLASNPKFYLPVINSIPWAPKSQCALCLIDAMRACCTVCRNSRRTGKPPSKTATDQIVVRTRPAECLLQTNNT